MPKCRASKPPPRTRRSKSGWCYIPALQKIPQKAASNGSKRVRSCVQRRVFGIHHHSRTGRTVASSPRKRLNGRCNLARGNIAIYRPPEKGLPFLVVIVFGLHVAQSKGAETRKEAEAIYAQWCEE